MGLVAAWALFHYRQYLRAHHQKLHLVQCEPGPKSCAYMYGSWSDHFVTIRSKAA